MSRQNLRKDIHGEEVQAFVPDPSKSQVPQSLAGTLDLSTLLTIGDCLAIVIRANADITRYFNGETTKTRTIPANVDTLIMIDENVTELTLSGNATVEIEAM